MGALTLDGGEWVTLRLMGAMGALRLMGRMGNASLDED